MRVGPNASYQRTGTIMHEMNHAVGVGTTPVWCGPSSAYRASGSSGDWLGIRATELVRFLQNDPDARVHGDNTHMWPYGINGAHEDDGTELLYLANGLVTQALHEDALVPTSAWHTPSYTLDVDDDAQYYIISDSQTSTANFLTASAGVLTITAMDSPSAEAAWSVQFDPATGLYSFRHTASGQWLTCSASGWGIRTVDAPTTGQKLQLSHWLERSTYPLGLADGAEALSYWIVMPDGTGSPRCLEPKSATSVGAATVRFAGDAQSQRWLVVPASAQSAIELPRADSDGIPLWPCDVYGIDGRLVQKNATGTNRLAPGFYIAGGKKIAVN